MAVGESPGPGVWERLRADGARDMAAVAEGGRQELARRHLLDFVGYTFPGYRADPFHAAVAERLERFVAEVEGKRSPRVMLFAPPQFGKSELTSRRFPAWVLGRHPDWRIILASYGADWAEELSGDARAIVRSDEYSALFGRLATESPQDEAAVVEIDKARKSVASWKISKHRGGMAAVGVGGAITGRPADIEVVDDPIKGRKEADSETYRDEAWKWWPQARDRLQEGGGILVMATRWHHDDLPGRLLKLARENPAADQWEVLNYTAFPEERGVDPLGRAPGESLAPSRFSAESILTLKATVGSREWSAKFMGRPTDDEGALFRREWWRYEPLTRANPRAIYQFWDLAFSRRSQADYSVCTTWGVEPGPTYRLLDVYRERRTFGEIKATARRLYEEWSKKYAPVRVRAVVVEKRGREDELYREFRRDTRLPVLWYVPDRDKLGRANAVTPLIEGGSVILPDFAPWKEEYLEEMSRFPAGEHDDQVDSTTMALICLGVRGIRLKGLSSLRDFRVVGD